MADDNVADNMANSTQKAYNRAIDAPTVVKPSVAATIPAINQLNILALCSPWIKVYIRPIQGPLRLRHQREEVHRQVPGAHDSCSENMTH
eukprot:1006348-Prorocentrum_minimum.AAC.1